MSIRNYAFATGAVAGMMSILAAGVAHAQATASRDSAPVATASAQAAAPLAERRYTLVDVGGKALPVEVEKGWRCREEVTAGTLILREDNRWRLETSVREVCGDRTRMDNEDEDGMYRREGTTIQFLDDDGNRDKADWSVGQEIEVDDLDRGSVAEGGMLTVRLADDKTVLRFKGEAS